MLKLCPACKTKMIPGEWKAFETLGDAICYPNDAPPLRPTIMCPNVSCEAGSHEGIFWSKNGEGPYSRNWKKLEMVKWIDNNPNPFGTYARQIYFDINYHDEDKMIRLGKLVLKREVHYSSNDYGDKIGKHVHYSLIWNGIYWTPGWKMIAFGLRMLRNAKKRGDKELSQEVEGLMARAKWPRAEWWRKVMSLWVRVFYRDIAKKYLTKEIR